MILTSALISWDEKTFSPVLRSVLTTAKGLSPLPPSTSKTAVSSKERFVRKLFDQISPGYDLFNRICSFGLDSGWRRKTIDKLALKPQDRVLDLASGTGDLSGLIAQQIVPLGKVVACDLSYPMLVWARRKGKQHPALRWHATFSQGKAEALPFAEDSFDAATMGFALRNVSDLNQTFQEFSRVLRRQGKLCLLEFGKPKNIFLQIGHWFWLTVGVPLVGWVTTGSVWPFWYLRRSILQFMAPEEVVRRLEAAGFTQVQAQPLNGGIVFLYSGVRS